MGAIQHKLRIKSQTGTLSHLRSILDVESAGYGMFALIRELFPICRSITGDGLRRSLARIGKSIPLVMHEVPTGTQVLNGRAQRILEYADATSYQERQLFLLFKFAATNTKDTRHSISKIFRCSQRWMSALGPRPS
jgi:uncharacterized protein DUF4910